MLLQQSPFRGEDEDEIYDAILADEPLYPIHMPRDSVSILQKLLMREPELRLGSGPTDAQEIMSHAFCEYSSMCFLPFVHSQLYRNLYRKLERPFRASIASHLPYVVEILPRTATLTPKCTIVRNINWDDFRDKKVPPPFQPQISNPTDTSNFDSEFTSVTPVLTPVQSGKLN